MVHVTAVHMVGGNGHEHIGKVGWQNSQTGDPGESTRAVMVEWIRDEKGDARVNDGRTEVHVGVVNADPPYLRTYADGTWTDNLLALPRY